MSLYKTLGKLIYFWLICQLNNVIVFAHIKRANTRLISIQYRIFKSSTFVWGGIFPYNL